MTVRDQIFLYCYVIYGQKEEILSALPPERMELLKMEVRKYDRFPKEVRLTLVLKLLGYLVRHARNRYLDMIHPTWVAEFLKKETAHVNHIVLGQMTPDYRKKIVQLLPTTLEFSKTESEQAEIKEAVFQIFLAHFASMAAPWGEPELTISSLYLLREEDLIAIAKQLGVREMARAFTVAGKRALSALANRFPAELQEDFQLALDAVSDESPERQGTAARQLSRYDLASVPAEEAAFRVGLARMACAVHQSGADLKQVAQRLPCDVGTFLLSMETGEPTGDESKEVIDIIHKLVARGRIDKSFVENRFVSTEDISKKSGKISGTSKVH